jgi:CHAD domain-containing protein
LEIEAKFIIPDERTFQQLLGITSLAGFRLGEASVSEFCDRYLDTADRSILAEGYACRLRHNGDRYLATLKGLGGASGAIHRRDEHEVAMAEFLPPQAWRPSTARDLALRLCGDQALITLFTIEQTRYSRPLHEADRLVAELSLDRVRLVQGDGEQSAYLELEVELLRDGREQELETLASELCLQWNLRSQSVSKFERALALLDAKVAYEAEIELSPESHLSQQERTFVEQLTHEREVIARRARLLLAWDDDLSRTEMIERSGLSPRRVRHWLHAFSQRRLGIFPERALETVAAGTPSLSPVVTEELPAVRLEIALVEEAAPLSPLAELLDRPGIEPDDPMSEAGRKTFRFHYRRMIFYEPGTRLGEDIEALHDMRVATRRMRAAFRVFGDYFDPQVVAPYLKGLKRTGRTLGAVRDLDVFREKIQSYLVSLPESQQSSLDGLLAVLEARRDAARERMTTYLDSKKHHRFTQAFGEFVETEGMGSLPGVLDTEEPRPYHVRHVAPMAIYERLAVVRAYDEWVNIPNPPLTRLHALRIACKKLRYTLEFFSEVLGPGTKALIKQVVAMQDHLGNLQDAVVASGILRDFLVWGTWGHDDADLRQFNLESPVIAPGVAAYLAAKQSELQHLLDAFPKAWQQIKEGEFSQMVATAVAVL